MLAARLTATRTASTTTAIAPRDDENRRRLATRLRLPGTSAEYYYEIARVDSYIRTTSRNGRHLQRRLAEIKLVRSVVTSPLQVIDRPRVGYVEVKSKKFKVAVVSGLAGIGMGLLFMCCRNRADLSG